MSRYVKQTTFRTKFDGDDVVVGLKPLEYGDLIRLEALTRDASKKLSDGEAVQMYADILPRYIVSVEGLTDAAGTPITMEELCRSVYFAELIAEIGNALMTAVNPENPKKPA
jgi:hypothetical protein